METRFYMKTTTTVAQNILYTMEMFCKHCSQQNGSYANDSRFSHADLIGIIM